LVLPLGVEATVDYAGTQGTNPGLDQINVTIPQSLAGTGNVPVLLSVGGMTSLNVTIVGVRLRRR
jgi:uncharacterized protein (TIGR03437 family)